jgi:hypothetical protein
MFGQKVSCGCPPSGTVWAPQEEIHLQGQDCAGNLADFVGKPTQIVQTVPKPGAVQDVRLCGTVACQQLLVAVVPIWVDFGESGIQEGSRYWYQDSCTLAITSINRTSFNEATGYSDYPLGEIYTIANHVQWYYVKPVSNINTPYRATKLAHIQVDADVSVFDIFGHELVYELYIEPLVGSVCSVEINAGSMPLTIGTVYKFTDIDANSVFITDSGAPANYNVWCVAG